MTNLMYYYIACANTKDAQNFLRNQDILPYRNKQYLAEQLSDFVNEAGEDGLFALTELHPDKELLLAACNGKKLNCCGACGADGQPLGGNPNDLNRTTQPAGAKPKKKLLNINQTTWIIAGSLLFVGTGILFLIRSKRK